MRPLKVKARVSQGIALLAMVRSHSTGNPLTSESGLAVTVRQDFGDFGLVGEGIEINVYNPPNGTPSNPDPRWHPAVDGDDGFNVEVLVPDDVFTQIGQYVVALSGQSVRQVWFVQVGSGD